MTWIAAATLLLPARRALEASFKVFSSIPQRTEHRIAAAPADLFPQLAPGRGGTAFVIDARTGAADDGPISERAAFYARRFTADGDPYDVVDAVELADALGGKDQHLGGRDARLTAWALTRPDDELTEPTALFRWLHGASRELLSEHGAGVAALLLEAAPSGEVLRWIDAAVADGRLDADPAAVRLRLLTAELAAIRDGQQAPVQEMLPPARLDPDAVRDAESELSSAILLGSNQQADRLLCLARRHGIVPELAAPLQQRLRDFVSAWIDHPAGYQPSGWVLRTEILDCAHDELRHRATDGGMRSVHEHIRRLNKFFGDRADLGDPLDCQIQASLIAAGDRAQRVKRLRHLIGLVGKESTSGGAAAAAPLQRALIEWGAADGEVAVIVVTELPASFQVENVIAARAAESLDQASRKPTRALLDLLDRLDRQGKAPEADKFARLIQDDRLVRSFIHRAAQDRIATDLRYIEDAVQTLQTADPLVVEARLDEVLDACLHARHPQLGAVVLASLKAPLPRLIVERWGQTLGQRDQVSDAWWCLSCLLYEDLPDRRHGQLAAAIRDYAKTLPPEDFEAWYEEVAREAVPHEREVWDWLFPKDAPRPRINLWRTRDGGRP